MSKVTLTIVFDFLSTLDGADDWTPERRQSFMEECVFPVKARDKWRYEAQTIADRVIYECTMTSDEYTDIRRRVVQWDKTKPIWGVNFQAAWNRTQ